MYNDLVRGADNFPYQMYFLSLLVDHRSISSANYANQNSQAEKPHDNYISEWA